MLSSTTPKRYRFSFGPWNISTGADPFGPPVRKEMEFARKLKAYKELGFDAVQFNLVFASNPARSLYERLGWVEIGRIPEAVDGEDALIYWRRVGP